VYTVLSLIAVFGFFSFLNCLPFFIYVAFFIFLSYFTLSFSDAESQASQASLLSDRDVVNKIKCLIDIERKLRLELGEHEKKVKQN
jgi:hypothetical protein